MEVFCNACRFDLDKAIKVSVQLWQINSFLFLSECISLLPNAVTKEMISNESVPCGRHQTGKMKLTVRKVSAIRI